MSDPKQIAKDIYELIKNYKVNEITNCYTRLRFNFDPNFTIPPDSLAEEIKKINGVLGVVHSNNEYQIIIGTGLVDKVRVELNELIKIVPNDAKQNNTNVSTSNINNFDETKKKFRKNIFSQTLSKFSKIFAPIIPCFIASGIITAIAIMIQICTPDFNLNDTSKASTQWYNFFFTCIRCWVSVFLVIIGWRFNEIFGGKPWCGAIMGAMFASATGGIYQSLYSSASHTFLGIPVHSVNWNWFTAGFAKYNVDTGIYEVGAPTGSMIGVILACIASIYVERFWTKVIPQSVGFVITPVITILSLLLINFLLIFTLSGYFILGLSWIFEHITQGQIAPFGDMVLAGLYLFLLTFGLSSSLIPVYTMLLGNYNLNTVYPLLGMAGFGQIGAAVALYIVSKKGSNYRKNIKSSIISGFLGIDEPLCYGMSIPKIVPFVTTCISAAISGFLIGGAQAWLGINMGVHMIYGIDGIWGLFTVTSTSGSSDLQPIFGKLVYFVGISATFVCGFIFTTIAYRIFKNSTKIKWELD